MTESRLTAAQLILVVCLGLNGIAAAQTVDIRSLSPGTKMPQTFRVAEKLFVLPEGEWRLMAQADSTGPFRGSSELGNPFTKAYLADIREGRLFRAVYVSTNTEQNRLANRGSYWLADPCKQSDLIHKFETKRSLVDFTCMLINHRVFARTTTDPLSRDARKQMTAFGASYATTMITAQFTRATPYHLMEIWYYFNPEIDGFAPSADSSWSGNDWHVDVIGKDPRKVAYVEEIKKWSTAMVTWIQGGFEGQLPAGQPVPQPFATTRGPESKPAKAEDRLRELKRLRDQGLITQEVYETEQRRVLAD
jgi:hypothetical protein